MTLRSYVGTLCRFVISSSLALALIVFVALLISGGASITGELTLDVSRLDGIWLLLGLPLLAVLLLVIVSPLSYLLHRKLWRGMQKDAHADDP